MCASWNQGYDPSLLVARLESIITKREETQISFAGFEFPTLVTVIHSFVHFAEGIPEVEQNRIVARGITAAAKRGTLASASILQEISRKEGEYLSQPFQRFTLFTSISIRYSDNLKRATISNCTITFTQSIPKRIRRGDIVSSAHRQILGDLPQDYAYVQVSTQARSDYDAAERALNALDLLRGIWNLSRNQRTEIRLSSGKRLEPINAILLGPFHTLHDEQGKLATETYWYEPGYTGPLTASDSTLRWQDIRKWERYIRRCLSNHKYRLEVEAAIIRYTRALDDNDFNSAYIKLWGVLEALTDTTKVPNEEAIRRVSFLYDERNFHSQILRHLVSYRNRTVHLGKEAIEIETLLYQLKGYVERLLLFHLPNVHNFENLRSAAQFLTQPTELDVLQGKIDTLQKALKFRYGKRK